MCRAERWEKNGNGKYNFQDISLLVFDPDEPGEIFMRLKPHTVTFSLYSEKGWYIPGARISIWSTSKVSMFITTILRIMLRRTFHHSQGKNLLSPAGSQKSCPEYRSKLLLSLLLLSLFLHYIIRANSCDPWQYKDYFHLAHSSPVHHCEG